MKDLLKAIINLLKVKSILTLCAVFVIVFLTVRGEMPNELLIAFVTSVLTYYFNKKDSNE